jgi:hypothetical protein
MVCTSEYCGAGAGWRVNPEDNGTFTLKCWSCEETDPEVTITPDPVVIACKHTNWIKDIYGEWNIAIGPVQLVWEGDGYNLLCDNCKKRIEGIKIYGRDRSNDKCSCCGE